MDTDKKIIMQVAAKIASDMVTKEADTDTKLGEFALLFDSIKNIMFEAIEDAQPKATVYEMVKSTFNVTSSEGVSTLPSTSGEALQIIGKQHGDIPDWLIKACKRDGVSKVYDNRDGLAANAKRPWFRAVEGEKAYWAPKTRG
tara:strand:- start:922 stop:1350 length:429 start_codon:yes stop_codon:yes gene_type:complete